MAEPEPVQLQGPSYTCGTTTTTNFPHRRHYAVRRKLGRAKAARLTVALPSGADVNDGHSDLLSSSVTKDSQQQPTDDDQTSADVAAIIKSASSIDNDSPETAETAECGDDDVGDDDAGDDDDQDQSDGESNVDDESTEDTETSVEPYYDDDQDDNTQTEVDADESEIDDQDQEFDNHLLSSTCHSQLLPLNPSSELTTDSCPVPEPTVLSDRQRFDRSRPVPVITIQPGPSNDEQVETFYDDGPLLTATSTSLLYPVDERDAITPAYLTRR